MSETRYAIRMTTPKGEFWWTGSMTDRQDFGHGKFYSFGWTANRDNVDCYMRRRDADKKAAALESSLQRMFEIERIEVVPVQWSNFFGWQPTTNTQEPAS